MENRLEQLEVKLSYLQKTTDEMSDIIALQDKEIGILKRRVQMLMEREAERELDMGGSVPLADQKPPHW